VGQADIALSLFDQAFFRFEQLLGVFYLIILREASFFVQLLPESLERGLISSVGKAINSLLVNFFYFFERHLLPVGRLVLFEAMHGF